MSAEAGSAQARVFIALCPDVPLRQRLAEEAARLRKALGGRITRPETLHLTLVFIGDLPRARLAGLAESLRGVAPPGFQLTFDRAECWRRNRIAFLAPSRPPDALFGLVDALESLLDREAVPYDRRPYQAHVTLLRKANCIDRQAPPAGGLAEPPAWGDFRPIIWSASDFVLMESTLGPAGAEHRVVERFRLGGSKEDVAFQVSG